MSSTRKWLRIVVAALGVVVVAGGAFAWACTQNANVSAFPKSGVGGSTAVIDGAGFTAGPVELRWDAINGQLLAVAQGPKFLTEVTIPKGAELGLHNIVAVHVNAMAGHRGIGYTSAPFTVVALEAPAPPQKEAAPRPQPESQPQAQPQARPEPARMTLSFAPQNTAASERAVATAAQRGNNSGTAAKGPAGVPPVSDRAVFGDATGGFTSAVAPSLADAATGTLTAGETRSPIALGLALLAFGCAALMGGGLVVLLGRRPAPAVQQHEDN